MPESSTSGVSETETQTTVEKPVPMRIGVCIPTYPGCPALLRAIGFLAVSAESLMRAEPGAYEFKFFVEEGNLVPRPDPKEKEVYWEFEKALAAEIWGLRHRAFQKAFEWGAEWCASFDTDVMVPVDFWFRMLRTFPDVEAKTCTVLGVHVGTGRKTDERFRLVSPDALTCVITGEVYFLRRSLYDRLDKNIDPMRANEDVQMGEKVRAAGATYYIVPGLSCLAD